MSLLDEHNVSTNWGLPAGTLYALEGGRVLVMHPLVLNAVKHLKDYDGRLRGAEQLIVGHLSGRFDALLENLAEPTAYEVTHSERVAMGEAAWELLEMGREFSRGLVDGLRNTEPWPGMAPETARFIARQVAFLNMYERESRWSRIKRRLRSMRSSGRSTGY